MGTFIFNHGKSQSRVSSCIWLFCKWNHIRTSFYFICKTSTKISMRWLKIYRWILICICIKENITNLNWSTFMYREYFLIRVILCTVKSFMNSCKTKNLILEMTLKSTNHNFVRLILFLYQPITGYNFDHIMWGNKFILKYVRVNIV